MHLCAHSVITTVEAVRCHWGDQTLIKTLLEPGFLPRNYLCFYWPAIQHSVLGLHRECSIRVISYWGSGNEAKKGAALLQSVVTYNIGMTSKMDALVSVHDCVIKWSFFAQNIIAKQHVAPGLMLLAKWARKDCCTQEIGCQNLDEEIQSYFIGRCRESVLP